MSQCDIYSTCHKASFSFNILCLCYNLSWCILWPIFPLNCDMEKCDTLLQIALERLYSLVHVPARRLTFHWLHRAAERCSGASSFTAAKWSRDFWLHAASWSRKFWLSVAKCSGKLSARYLGVVSLLYRQRRSPLVNAIAGAFFPLPHIAVGRSDFQLLFEILNFSEKLQSKLIIF